MDKQLELEQMQYTSNELIEQTNQIISIAKLLRYPLNRCFELTIQISQRQDSKLSGDKTGADVMTESLSNALQVIESLVGLGLSCEERACYLKAYFEGEGKK